MCNGNRLCVMHKRFFSWACGWFKWKAEWDRREFLLGNRISLTHIKVNHDD